MNFAQKANDPGLTIELGPRNMIFIKDLMFHEEVIIPMDSVPTLITELNKLYKENNE